MPIIIAQHDPFVAKRVALELRAHFGEIAVVRSSAELFPALLRHQARVAVLDLELIKIDEVQELARQLSHLLIVCTHRSPDERMWMAALNAGAVEVCHPADIHLIVRASRKLTRGHAVGHSAGRSEIPDFEGRQRCFHRTA